MTNVDRVKEALRSISGNKVFNSRAVNVDELTVEQIGKAIRSIPYVKNLGNGKYRIKGRKV